MVSSHASLTSEHTRNGHESTTSICFRHQYNGNIYSDIFLNKTKAPRRCRVVNELNQLSSCPHVLKSGTRRNKQVNARDLLLTSRRKITNRCVGGGAGMGQLLGMAWGCLEVLHSLFLHL